jgi:hypothetical protein
MEAGKRGQSRIRSAASGALRASRTRVLACRCPRTGVHQTAVRRVIGEQQRAYVRPAALRVRPADHDELFPIQALGFQPRAPLSPGRYGASARLETIPSAASLQAFREKAALADDGDR